MHRQPPAGQWRYALLICSGILHIAVTAAAEHVLVEQATRTVWDGVYTEEQARRGEEAYLKDCAPCHQKDLYGDEYATPLVRGAFYDRWNDKSIAALYSTIRSTMPQDQPGSLPTQAYVDVISYVLKMNEMPPGKAELPTDTNTLEQIMVRHKPLR